jgi:hypothetical protein
MSAVPQHLLHVIEPDFAITVWIANPIVNNPKPVCLWVNIRTSDNPDALDEPVDAATLLAAN